MEKPAQKPGAPGGSAAPGAFSAGPPPAPPRTTGEATRPLLGSRSVLGAPAMPPLGPLTSNQLVSPRAPAGSDSAGAEKNPPSQKAAPFGPAVGPGPAVGLRDHGVADKTPEAGAKQTEAARDGDPDAPGGAAGFDRKDLGRGVVAFFPARATPGAPAHKSVFGGQAGAGAATSPPQAKPRVDPQAELSRIASTARLSARAPRRVTRGTAAEITFTLDLGGRRAEAITAVALSFRDPDDAFNLRPATDPLVWITPSTTEPLNWRIAATADRPGGRALLVSARFDAPNAVARTEPKLLEISVDDAPDNRVRHASLVAGGGALLFLFGMVFPSLLEMFFQ